MENIVAWYAAVISTSLLILEIIKYFKDKSHVVLKCEAGQRIINSDIYDPDKDHMMITVINKGRRPVTIGNVGYIYKGEKSKGGILNDSLINGNRELTEGKSTQYLFQEALLDLKKVKYFVAYDKTGKIYKGKIKKK